MRKLDHKKTLGTWVSLPEDSTFKIKIRPLNIITLNIKPTSLETTQQEMFEWFDYIVLDWSGYEDEEGKPIECNSEMKQIVFNYDYEIVTFVLTEATKLRDGIVTLLEADNLKKLVGGEVANSAN